MYARVLRKWSLIKYLMYLWLPVVMLLVICCQNVISMPLSINIKLNTKITSTATTTTTTTTITTTTMVPPYNFLDDTRSIDDHHQYNNDNSDDHNLMPVKDIRYGSNKRIIISSNNYLKQQPYEVLIRSNSLSNAAVNRNAAVNVLNVPNLNSQIINLNNNNNNNNNNNYNSDDYISLTNKANNKNLLNENYLIDDINNSGIHSNISKINYMHSVNESNKNLNLKLSPNFTPSFVNYNNNNKKIQILYNNNNNNKKPLLSKQNDPSLMMSSLHNSNENNERAFITNFNRDKKPEQLLLFNLKQNNYWQLNNSQINDENTRIKQKLIETNERLLQQQEVKRARINAHRLRLMRRKQLPIISNYYDDRNRNSSVNNKLITTMTTIETDNDLNKLMIGRNRRDSRSFSSLQVTPLSSSSSTLLNQRHFQHQQQERKRPKRYCSARDPTQLAFEAPTVFEGKIKSMSYDRRANFSVTFEVKEIYKCQLDYKLPELLRLQFTYSNLNSECDIYREHLRLRGIVNDELEQGRVYILFVKQITKGNFTILGQPIKRTRRAVNAVRLGVSEKYAQPASIKSLTANRTTNKIIMRDGDTLRLLCKVKGQPPPKVTWFKDGKSISRNRLKTSSLLSNQIYQFIHLKKRSELIIRPFNSTYAGLYECRAKNKVHKRPAKETIRVEAFSRNSPTSDETSFGGECPGDMQSYCLNGATCRYFRDIHEKSCVCPEGYNGERCQEKTTTLNTSTYQKEHQQCESYKGGFYC